jgi:glycosyltransferase involved in cell wall biosynthesis
MASDRITVSVITPCYNGAPYLQQTLQSVVSQTTPPLEVIVIDDGSTDDSAKIAEAFGPPVRVLRQANQGESVARNRGIAEARGTHVLFLDADDLLAPHALEKLTSALDGIPNAVALMCVAWFTEDPTRPIGAIKTPIHRRFLPAIISENFAPPHSWLTPIEMIRRAGGFAEHLRWFEDWDLWWRVGLLDPAIVPVDYVGALYRQHARSQLATTKMADRTRGHAMLMERMAAAILADPSLTERYGDTLFWNCWTALIRAHRHRVAWDELRPLADQLQQILARRPPGLAGSWTARMIGLLGVRTSIALGSLRANAG